MYLKKKEIKQFEINEEQRDKIREMKEFALHMKLNFKEGTCLYELIDNYEKFLTELLNEYGFTDNGEVFVTGKNSYQPFIERGK